MKGPHAERATRADLHSGRSEVHEGSVEAKASSALEQAFREQGDSTKSDGYEITIDSDTISVEYSYDKKVDADKVIDKIAESLEADGYRLKHINSGFSNEQQMAGDTWRVIPK